MRANHAKYCVTALCRALEVSASGFYAWNARTPSKHERRDVLLGDRIEAMHRRSRSTYGRPRVHAELVDEGIAVSGKRVARLMGDLPAQADRRRAPFGPGLAVRVDRVRQPLHDRGRPPSMGSVGDCYDDAMCESSNATLECELLVRRRSKKQREAVLAVFDFIEGWYDPHRCHFALGYLSPANDERRAKTAA